MSISSVVCQKAGSAFNKAAKSKFISKQLEKGVKDPAKFAAQMMVASIVSKDAINCALYTYQSYNNERIPEDKRKFVASLDLMNGILNVGGQILAAMLIERMWTPNWVSKFTGTLKNKDTGDEKFVSSKAPMAEDNLKAIVTKVVKASEEKVNIKDLDMKGILKEFSENHKGKFVNGFGLLVAALGTMALVKRTLVPLVSTPLAGWFKDKFMSDDDKKPELNMTPAMVDMTIPKVGEDKQNLDKRA